MRRSAVLSALSVLPVLGAIVGVWLTLEAGTVCVDRDAGSFCGLNFLVWNLSSPAAIVLSAALGAVAGMAIYALAAVLLMRRV